MYIGIQTEAAGFFGKMCSKNMSHPKKIGMTHVLYCPLKFKFEKSDVVLRQSNSTQHPPFGRLMLLSEKHHYCFRGTFLSCGFKVAHKIGCFHADEQFGFTRSKFGAVAADFGLAESNHRTADVAHGNQ